MLHIQQTPESGEGSAAKKGRGLVGRVVAAAVSVVMLGSMSFAPGLALADSAQTTTQNNTTVVAGDTAAPKTSDVSKVQAAVNALPDTTAAGFAVNADNVNTLNQQLEAAQSAYKALSATQQAKIDMTYATNLAGAIQTFKQAQADAGQVTAKWPKGVTDEDVKDYIFKNFSTDQFADAVWTAISTSGQDFTKRYRDEDNGNISVMLRNAGDVVKYFEGSVTIANAFSQSLKGITLLNHAGTLTLLDTSNWEDLSFIEDAYPGGDSNGPKSPKGPAVILRLDKAVALDKLPKTTYDFNLTRIPSGLHYFPTSFYNSRNAYLLRGSSQTSQVSIDTKLKTSDGSAMDLSKTDSLDPSDSAAGGKPGQQIPTHKENSYPSQDSTSRNGESPIANKSNLVEMSISPCAADGVYQQDINFQLLYKYYSGTSLQINSVDYHYFLDVASLSTLGVQGVPTVISGFRVKKIGPSGESLSGAKFDVYTNEARTQKATQVVVDSKGNPEWDSSGNLKVAEVPTTATDKDGYLTVSNLLPGTYYLQEVSAPKGYEIVDNKDLKPVVVKSSIGAVEQPIVDVNSGETNSAQLLSPQAHFIAQYEGQHSSWSQAAALVDAPGSQNTYEATASDHGGQVFIKNYGSDIAVSSDGITANKYTKVLSGYKVGDKSFDTLQEAVDYVNGVIADGQLSCTTPTITIDGSKAVYLDTSYEKADPIKVTDPVKPGQVQFQMTKTYKEGNELKAFPEAFTFRLTAVDANAKRLLGNRDFEDTVLPEGTAGNATAAWGALTVTGDEFNAAKDKDGVATYTFEASEVPGKNDLIHYDKTTYKIVLKVTEDGKNGLTGDVFLDGKKVGTFTSKDNETTPFLVKGGKDGIEFDNTKNAEFDFTKVDGSDGKNTPLAGATFRLYQCSDTSLTCATSTDPITDFDNPGSGWKKVDDQTSAPNTGLVEFKDLADGTYRLVEIQAPDGYLRPAGQWTVKIANAVVSGPEAVANNGTQPPAFETDTDGTLSVPNYTPTVIPQAGGRGLIVFATLGGALLLAGVTVVTIDSRRRAQLQ